jgi:hypothetical protein
MRALKDWNFASELDPTLSVSRRHIGGLRRKRVSPTAFTLSQLFGNMATGTISLFTDYPSVTTRAFQRVGIVEALSRLNRREVVGAWHNEDNVRIKIGQLIQLWDAGKGHVGITDLHFRKTPTEQLMNLDRLCHFDVLHRSTDDVRRQEMMTFILSTKGQVTDSHSDDPDGSNHCLFGRKLWLAWDTYEGIENGLEDDSRKRVETERASFDIDTFLSLKSSRWFFVETGQTLFLPGNLTHKVITLEKYAGISAFYVTLPNYLRTMSRWLVHKPSWDLGTRANRHLVDEIGKTALSHLRSVKRGSAYLKRKSGFHSLPLASRTWEQEYSEEVRERLMQNRNVAAFRREMAR